jgi:hypothetical protein
MQQIPRKIKNILKACPAVMSRVRPAISSTSLRRLAAVALAASSKQDLRITMCGVTREESAHPQYTTKPPERRQRAVRYGSFESHPTRRSASFEQNYERQLRHCGSYLTTIAQVPGLARIPRRLGTETAHLA